MENGKKLTGTGHQQINQSPFGKKPLKSFSTTYPNLFFFLVVYIKRLKIHVWF
jgi:hypothetical protein